jgi:predicted O-methyltransferase YrrM
MTQKKWTAVDDYIAGLFVGNDPVLDSAQEASAAAGLPAIAVSPVQGKFLYLLARFGGARRILEIGTLGGYSTIWLARALPNGGRLISLELSAHHAEVARANLARAKLSDLAEVRVGAALDSLRQLEEERAGPFDVIFIDADKPGYPDYWQASLGLSRPGTLIIADNVVREGAVVDAKSKDENVRAVRRYHELVAAETRVSAMVLQTVGSKGYDGLSLALVT